MSQGYRGLHVWVKGRALAVDIYRLTGRTEFAADRGLRDQMRRAAVSIASNIAEGSQRGSNRDSVKFFYIARGSTAELSTQIDIARLVGLVDGDRAEQLMVNCEEIERMLIRLIRARQRAPTFEHPGP